MRNFPLTLARAPFTLGADRERSQSLLFDFFRRQWELWWESFCTRRASHVKLYVSCYFWDVWGLGVTEGRLVIKNSSNMKSAVHRKIPLLESWNYLGFSKRFVGSLKFHKLSLAQRVFQLQKTVLPRMQENLWCSYGVGNKVPHLPCIVANKVLWRKLFSVEAMEEKRWTAPQLLTM